LLTTSDTSVGGCGGGDIGLGPAAEGGAGHHVPVVFQLLENDAQVA
jgi:hypothetical protein